MEESKAVRKFYATAKGKRLEILFSRDDRILFWNSVPVAVVTGECCYYLDAKNPAAATRAIHEFAETALLIRTSAGDFDFVVGSLLTKVGLPLTRRS